MRRRYGYYWTKLIGAVLVLAAWVVAFVWIGDCWWQLVSAAVLAVVMTQIAFLGHDAAHRQIFKSGRWNDWVSLVVANLLVGISYGWWQSKHTRHHANPNKEGADPDIASERDRHDPGAGEPPPQPADALAGGAPGLVLLPAPVARGALAALRTASSGCSSRTKVERRWVEMTFLDLPARRPGRAGVPRAAAREGRWPSSPSSWPSSASTWVSRSRRTTSGCRWSRRSSSWTSCAGRC